MKIFKRTDNSLQSENYRKQERSIYHYNKGTNVRNNQIENFYIEKIRSKAQNSILIKGGLFYNYSSMIKTVLRSVELWKFTRLFHQSVLCICKFMIVDKIFCKKNIELLLYILENKKCPSIDKFNIVIALGKMCCHFPNDLDLRMENLYILLESKDNEIRKISLFTLINLILNDIIKPKLSIVEIVKLVEDNVDEIRYHANLFFLEFNKKNK